MRNKRAKALRRMARELIDHLLADKTQRVLPATRYTRRGDGAVLSPAWRRMYRWLKRRDSHRHAPALDGMAAEVAGLR